MPGPLSRPLLPTLLGLLTITTLFYYLSLAPASAALPNMSAANSNSNNNNNNNNDNNDENLATDQHSPILSHLAVSLRQTRTDPPTIAARVANTHPFTPFTLLAWDTPLDPLALKLGLAALTLIDGGGSGGGGGEEGEEEALSLPTIQVRRRYPPDPDAVVTIAPGEAREREFVLEAPVVPVDRIREAGGRVRVGFRGTWNAVWAVERGRPVGALGADGERLSGAWESGSIEVVV